LPCLPSFALFALFSLFSLFARVRPCSPSFALVRLFSPVFAFVEVLVVGKCSRRDKGCLRSGPSVAEVGELTTDGGRLEVSGRRGNGSASDREGPLGLTGSGTCTREIGMRGPGAGREVVQTMLPRRIEPREGIVRELWTQR
jgi:hypothetical protein